LDYLPRFVGIHALLKGEEMIINKNRKICRMKVRYDQKKRALLGQIFRPKYIALRENLWQKKVEF